MIQNLRGRAGVREHLIHHPVVSRVQCQGPGPPHFTGGHCADSTTRISCPEGGSNSHTLLAKERDTTGHQH